MKGGNVVFCKYCGSKIRENSKFCENCGQPVDLPEKESFVLKSKKTFNTNGKKQKKQMNPVLQGVIIFVVVVLMILMILPSLFDDDSSSASDTTSEFDNTVNLALGETYSIDGLEYTVKDYEFVKTNESTMKYCILHVDLKNTKTERVDFSEWFSKYDYVYTLEYKGIEYYCSWGYNEKYIQNVTDLVPLAEVSDKWIQFEVPNEVAENSDVALNFILKPNKIDRTEKAIWSIR